ncbi:MAG: hypothetical protein ABIA21_02195 [Candidatus Aenigmatarchaeota archaeon]
MTMRKVSKFQKEIDRIDRRRRYLIRQPYLAIKKAIEEQEKKDHETLKDIIILLLSNRR